MGTEAAEGKPGAVAVCKDGQLFCTHLGKKSIHVHSACSHVG